MGGPCPAVLGTSLPGLGNLRIVERPHLFSHLPRVAELFRLSPRPPSDAAEAVRKGFAAYTAHCGKCHRMRGVGGEVGPALDREYSLSSVLTREQLLDYIRHDEGRYARSKMPRFSKLLSATEIDRVTSYVRAMQPARKQPPSKQK